MNVLLIFDMFQHFKSLSWTDYYEPSDAVHEIKNEKLHYSLQPTEGNTYVCNCYFESLTAIYGGAILYSGDYSNLLVEKSYFVQCQADRDSSSIRVNSGNCIISFVSSKFPIAPLDPEY